MRWWSLGMLKFAICCWIKGRSFFHAFNKARNQTKTNFINAFCIITSADATKNKVKLSNADIDIEVKDNFTELNITKNSEHVSSVNLKNGIFEKLLLGMNENQSLKRDGIKKWRNKHWLQNQARITSVKTCRLAIQA